MTSLAQLNVGQSATIEQIDGDDSIAARLMEMGLLPGVQTTVMGTAPLGDPIEIDVRNYRLSLRKAEASRVIVTLPESPPKTSSK